MTLGLTPILLVATTASASTPGAGTECEEPGVLVQDLHTVLEIDEHTVAEDAAQTTQAPAEAPTEAERLEEVADLSDVEWANQFFLTQIHDPRWNPSGRISDTGSNNCGPASLAMLLAAKGRSPANLESDAAIDHARATMYPAYPTIDASELPEGASLYERGGLVLVDDSGHPVYFDLVEAEPSLPQGISHAGGKPAFGYSWDQLNTLLQSSGAVIAHGHITQAWTQRFPGEYGSTNTGAVPHFITIFPASTEGDFVVADPMHRGGAVRMSQGELQTFFKSPINEYDTAIRVVTWEGSAGPGE